MNTLTQILTPLFIILGLVQPAPIIPEFTPRVVEPVVIVESIEESVVEPIVIEEPVVKENIVVPEVIKEVIVEEPVYFEPAVEHVEEKPDEKQIRFDTRNSDERKKALKIFNDANYNTLPARLVVEYIDDIANRECRDVLKTLDADLVEKTTYYNAQAQYDYYKNNCSNEYDDELEYRYKKLKERRLREVESYNKEVIELGQSWNVEYKHLLIK